MVTQLEFEIYARWKEVCGQINKTDDILLSLKWYEYFFKYKHIKSLQKKHEELHTLWHLYYDLLTYYKVFERITNPTLSTFIESDTEELK